MGKRSRFERIDKDLYRTTDPKPVARLLPWLAPGGSFVEPCVGWGDLVGPLMRAGHPCRGRYDLEVRYPGVERLDAHGFCAKPHAPLFGPRQCGPRQVVPAFAPRLHRQLLLVPVRRARCCDDRACVSEGDGMNSLDLTTEIRVGHLCCGSGFGARGFRKANARVGNLKATFRNIGGIDIDAAGIRDFEQFAGCKGTRARPDGSGAIPGLPCCRTAGRVARGDAGRHPSRDGGRAPAYLVRVGAMQRLLRTAFGNGEQGAQVPGAQSAHLAGRVAGTGSLQG
jgi:hypothetical protein